MKKTEVMVCVNGNLKCYCFEKDKESFMKIWHNHISAVGYIELDDDFGIGIIINPTNCSVIEIREIEA